VGGSIPLLRLDSPPEETYHMSIPPGEAADKMRWMHPSVVNYAIDNSENVVDGRARFDARRKQVELSRSYRVPRKPE
jgi:hypothetical protein